VPADQLVFLDVKDGWVPLCEALDLPVPKDVPFPRINDSEAIEELSKKCLCRGLVRWATILGTVGAAVAAVTLVARHA
jgi:hypothetical protein